MDQIVCKLLDNDIIKNLSIREFIKNYKISYSAVCGSSVLVKGKSDKLWTYISSSDEKEFKSLLRHISNEDKNFAVMEQWMLPLLPQYRTKAWELRTMRFYLPEYIHIDAPEIKPERLEKSDAPFILDNSDYGNYINEDYIIQRIESGPSACIKAEGNIVSWALTHDDGAIGALHTLEEYRGRGFAAAVVKYMILQHRKEDKIPFVYVEESNINSLNLIKKLGFIPDRLISWFEII